MPALPHRHPLLGPLAITVAVVVAASAGCSTAAPAPTGPGSGVSSSTTGAAAGAGQTGSAAPSPSRGAGATGTVIHAVASIDAWGSILSQLGGIHVDATSIISSPVVDPHSYEPTTADAITVAQAQLVVENGIGYDAWAAKAVAANPAAGRKVIDVGQLVGVPDGGNPHQWYSHASVYKVIDAITADLQSLDPADTDYFTQQKTRLEMVGFARYNTLEAQITTRDKDAPVGASESIASPLADSLGLTMKTPYSFLKAISEGTDPAPADIAAIDAQLSGHQIRVYLDNIQNSTPDVAAQVKAARAAGIPVVAITETLSPRGTSFQDWQSAQLTALAAALAAGGH